MWTKSVQTSGIVAHPEPDLKLSPALEARVAELAQAKWAATRLEMSQRTDRLFCALMLAQSIGAVLVAWLITPRTWVGALDTTHMHVWMTIGIGSSLSALVYLLTTTDPGRSSNVYAITIAQTLMGCLLIHLTGGRIETHFYLFGSLAFLAHYGRIDALWLMTTLTAIDHAVRGMVWPQSAFGTDAVEPWRWVEHSAWLVFEDVVLWVTILQRQHDGRLHARKWALLAVNKQIVEDEVNRQTRELELGQRQLEASRVRLSQVIETAHDAYICLDDQLAISQWSHRAEELLGWRDSDVLRRPCAEVLQVTELCEALQIAVTAARTHSGAFQSAALVETTALTASGQHMCIEVSWSVSECDAGLFANLFVRDITARKEQTELQMHSLKMESIGQLAAGIAHEINTPSQFVGDNLGFLEKSFQQIDSMIALARDCVDSTGQPQPHAVQSLHEKLNSSAFKRIAAEIPKALAQSQDGMQRISSITRAMKEFSHPGSQVMSAIDLPAAITSALAICRNEWKYVAEIKTEFAENMPPVSCLPGELSQVIVNLVVNAAQAIGDIASGLPGGRGRITIRTRIDHQHVELDVADNGPGIPANIRSRVFDPFFTTKPFGKGTGQGLAIAHAVMEKHHGSIRLTSSEGQGATFTLRWPAQPSVGMEKGSEDVFADSCSVCG